MTAVIEKNPRGRWFLPLDQFSKSLRTVFEVDGRLGSDQALLSDGSHDPHHAFDILDPRLANDHAREV